MPVSAHADIPSSDLISAHETAEYLRIPLPTVYYLLQRGKLPAVQIGGRWKIKKNELDTQVLQNNTPAVPTVTLCIRNNASRTLTHKTLTWTGVQFSAEPVILQNSKNQIIITDADLREQFWEQIASFRGQVITLISDKSDRNMAGNINHHNPMTFIFTEDVPHPTKWLRKALNLPQ